VIARQDRGPPPDRLVILGPAADTRRVVFSVFRTLRALALAALLLPGLVLSGAPQLCLCLGDLLGIGSDCAPLAQVGCCSSQTGLPSAFDAPDCGVCCITIAVAEPLDAAPARETTAADLPQLAAPPLVLLGTVPEIARAQAPARAAPPLASPPGRAPIPLRI
jgi:hypothetical protein